VAVAGESDGSPEHVRPALEVTLRRLKLVLGRPSGSSPLGGRPTLSGPLQVPPSPATREGETGEEPVALDPVPQPRASHDVEDPGLLEREVPEVDLLARYVARLKEQEGLTP